MRSYLLLAVLFAAAGASALTYHRSFRPIGVGYGVGARTSVPVDWKVAKALEEGQAAEAARPRVVIGRVTRVLDGVTFNLVTGGGTVFPVRLRDVLAPADVKAAAEAKARLKGLIGGRNVRVEFQSRDAQGRLLGSVTVGERDINGEMKGDGE